MNEVELLLTFSVVDPGRIRGFEVLDLFNYHKLIISLQTEIKQTSRDLKINYYVLCASHKVWCQSLSSPNPPRKWLKENITVDIGRTLIHYTTILSCSEAIECLPVREVTPNSGPKLCWRQTKDKAHLLDCVEASVLKQILTRGVGKSGRQLKLWVVSY